MMIEEGKVPKVIIVNKDGERTFSLTPIIITLVLVLIVAFAAGRIGYKMADNKHVIEDIEEEKELEKEEAVIDASYVSGRIESATKLISSELVYSGIIYYEDGDIPILTKNSFSMYYTATASAGIDFSNVDVEVTDTEVIVKIEKAEVIDVHVDPDSIKFYDEKNSLFNKSEKEDVADCIVKAEADFNENANVTSLLDSADAQAKALIYDILQGTVGDRSIMVINE